MKLTRRQQEILDFIRTFIHDHQFPPSIREIASHFSLASAGGVHKHLNNLKSKGIISFENNISRSIRILEPEHDRLSRQQQSNNTNRLIDLPLMGKVAAGSPIKYFLENESIEYPESMIRRPDETYALLVQGDSMIEDCICNGDFVIVEHRTSVDNGETAIVMINHEEATLKKVYQEGKKVRLQPANHTMEPIYVDVESVTIHGVVVGMLRQY